MRHRVRAAASLVLFLAAQFITLGGAWVGEGNLKTQRAEQRRRCR